MPQRPRAARASLAALLIVFAVAASGCAVGTAGRSFKPVAVNCKTFKFHSDRWRRDMKRPWNDWPRGEMSGPQATAHKLVRCKTLVGRSKREIRRMMWPTDAKIFGESPWYWDVGTNASGDETETLNVNFSGKPVSSDSDATVVDASIDSYPAD